MKTKTLLVVLFFFSLSALAQNRDIKLPQAPKSNNYRDYETQDKGFWCGIDVEGGSSVMEEKPNMQYAGFSFSGGYRVNEFLRVGAGLGLRCYVHNAYVRDTHGRLGIPIFASAKGNFISAYDRDGVPFWSFNVGGITQEGFFASPTLGYSFGGLRHTFQIGINYTVSCFRNSEKSNVAYSYFGIRLGYEF